MAWAQEKTVTGTVTAKDDGLPIPGASVKVKGTEQGTQTNGNGVFTLKVTGGNPVLVVSYIGYNVLEVSVVSVKGTNINVVLTQNDKSLSEVVVTGYATKSKRSTVGSISNVNVDNAMSQPNASFDQMLQGQVAGLNAKTGSGQPGRSADIIIRGKGSINGSNTPLYIVDGIEVRGEDFNAMNQNDFESISILKDASSTAIYGSRGAGGVIVITTKQGKSGALKVSYDGLVGNSYLPKNKLELMNATEKLDFEQGIAGNPNGWKPADFADLRQVSTNWNDYVFRKGKTQSHNLSLSGGNDKTTFYSSLGYYDEEGVTIATGIKKYTGRVNIRHTDKNIKIGANVSGGWSDYAGTTEGNQSVGSALNTVIWALPYEKPYNSIGGYGTSVQFPFWINPVEDLIENKRGEKQLK
ncbi:MAG: SusC/RagA family TonB-linked outer membrane protein, partial [Cytophagia bacterium]